MRYGIALIVASCASVTPTFAQTTASTAPDPARVTAARELVDVLMPPATREQMMRGMLAPMIANLRQGMAQNPQFAPAMGNNPKARALFEAFMARQQTRSIEQVVATLPGMTAAMANAYARRFDVGQLNGLKTFFATPLGRSYMQASYTIMSDPDVAAWQRVVMADSMRRVQDDIAGFVKDMAALQQDEKKP